MNAHTWLLAPALLAAGLCAGIGPAAAQAKPKSIDQIRAECQAENPPSTRSSSREIAISQCIKRKKEEAGKK